MKLSKRIKLFFLNRRLKRQLSCLPTVRHRIFIDGSSVLSFSAKPIESEEDLAELLENISKMLRAERVPFSEDGI